MKLLNIILITLTIGFIFSDDIPDTTSYIKEYDDLMKYHRISEINKYGSWRSEKYPYFYENINGWKSKINYLVKIDDKIIRNGDECEKWKKWHRGYYLTSKDIKTLYEDYDTLYNKHHELIKDYDSIVREHNKLRDIIKNIIKDNYHNQNN
tara:strand:- start:95 stop:547 length:453 start_codon:yes stop_codon:yes gene_type:complete